MKASILEKLIQNEVQAGVFRLICYEWTCLECGITTELYLENGYPPEIHTSILGAVRSHATVMHSTSPLDIEVVGDLGKGEVLAQKKPIGAYRMVLTPVC